MSPASGLPPPHGRTPGPAPRGRPGPRARAPPPRSAPGRGPPRPPSWGPLLEWSRPSRATLASSFLGVGTPTGALAFPFGTAPDGERGPMDGYQVSRSDDGT